MITALRPRQRTSPEYPTVWGLDPLQLHERFWAARGVGVVPQGSTEPAPADAEQYLLTDPRTLVVFRLRELVDLLSWVKPDVLFVRIRNTRDQDYRELVVSDAGGGFIGFRREYSNVDPRMARVALTSNRKLAELWRTAPDSRTAWFRLRWHARRGRCEAVTIREHAYDASSAQEVARFARYLTACWPYPELVIAELRKVMPGVWATAGTRVHPSVRFAGPVWIGAGRSLDPNQTVLGPAVLWDAPGNRPAVHSVPVAEIEPPQLSRVPRLRRRSGLQRLSKRAFDVVFALCVLLLTAPLYPIVMLAIWLEDGRPFFFGHLRETTGGREFACLKFRSMRKDAEQIKLRLARENQADGPQFFMENDPRLTRVGRIIRKLNIDELPQFLNVLAGDMAVVGPRPSPRSENQYCPAWREARLSVRPGITGLWQVSRTRTRGLDFQEWIKYDIEYVEHMGWRLDLRIVLKTVLVCLRGGR